MADLPGVPNWSICDFVLEKDMEGERKERKEGAQRRE